MDQGLPGSMAGIIPVGAPCRKAGSRTADPLGGFKTRGFAKAHFPIFLIWREPEGSHSPDLSGDHRVSREGGQ
jgi:hypothetical protein